MIKEIKRREYYPKRYLKVHPELEIATVGIGDTVLCCDEYAHDFYIHRLKVTSIEQETEDTETYAETFHLYGEDLDDDTDERIGVVTVRNFLGFVTC